MSDISGLMPDLCYVEHTGKKKVYTLKWRDERTNKYQTQEIGPGQKVLMPRTAVNVWFGDPDLANHPTDPRRKSRTEALERLSTLWGIFNGENWTNDDGTSKFPIELVVSDFSGNILPTIHRDPLGETLTPTDPTQITVEEQAKQLAALQSAVAQMQALIEQQGGEVPAITTAPPPRDEAPEPTVVDPESPATPDDGPTAPQKMIRNRAVTVKE